LTKTTKINFVRLSAILKREFIPYSLLFSCAWPGGTNFKMILFFQGFKAEWSTVKGNELWVGGLGKVS